MSFLWVLTMVVVANLALTTAASNSSFVCTEYSADNTASTTAAYCTCDIYLCPGDSVTISGCNSCNFDYQYIRLYNSNNVQVAYNDGTGSSCAPCAEIVNFVPAITYCQYYTLREGCLNNNQCNGEMEVTVTSLFGQATNKALRPGKPTTLGSSDPQLMLQSFGKLSLDSWNEFAGYSAANDSEASVQSSSSSTLPTCTYVIDLGALGLVIGIIVAIIVSSVCGFCCLAAICFFVCLPCIAPCWYASQQQQKQQQQQMQQQQQLQMHNVLHQQQQAGQPVYYTNGTAAVPVNVVNPYAQQPQSNGAPVVSAVPPTAAEPEKAAPSTDAAISDTSDIQKY